MVVLWLTKLLTLGQYNLPMINCACQDSAKTSGSVFIAVIW